MNIRVCLAYSESHWEVSYAFANNQSLNSQLSAGEICPLCSVELEYRGLIGMTGSSGLYARAGHERWVSFDCDDVRLGGVMMVPCSPQCLVEQIG
jgi:hypothetical protein